MESLRKSFIGAVSCAVAGMIVLSAATIWLCLAFQSWLLPDSDEIYITVKTIFADGTSLEAVHRITLDREEGTEQENYHIVPGFTVEGKDAQIKEGRIDSVEKIENSVDQLSPKRKLAYRFSQGAMVGFPLLYSILGILLCAIWFYRKKLAVPIRVLSDASAHIARKDLDFAVEYDSRDELGDLCRSFEQMRQTLYENNRELWNMLEERKLLHASVAHDLRNPIAVIEGYAEHLLLSMEAGSLTDRKLRKTAVNLQRAAKRLSCYTESSRHLDKLEEIEIHRRTESLPELLTELIDDFSVMAGQKGITLKRQSSLPQGEVVVDRQILFRIFENIIVNALRYARKEIQVDFTLEPGKLSVIVTDDGVGFDREILKQRDVKLLLRGSGSGEHIGMGLRISRILCKRHDGELRLANLPQGGASVTIVIGIDAPA